MREFCRHIHFSQRMIVHRGDTGRAYSQTRKPRLGDMRSGLSQISPPSSKCESANCSSVQKGTHRQLSSALEINRNRCYVTEWLLQGVDHHGRSKPSGACRRQRRSFWSTTDCETTLTIVLSFVSVCAILGLNPGSVNWCGSIGSKNVAELAVLAQNTL